MLAPTNDVGDQDEERDTYRLPDAAPARRVAEAVAAFDASPVDWPRQRHLPSPMRAWGGRNDLSLGARIGVTLAIAIGSALAFGAVLSGLESLARLS